MVSGKRIEMNNSDSQWPVEGGAGVCIKLIRLKLCSSTKGSILIAQIPEII